jgi:predicted outer membrane repeat protein
MTRVKTLFFLISMMFISSFSSYAAIIHIPGDQPTIQDGINAANNGDTVLIADGTYTGTGNKDLDPLGKAITIQSESNNPAVCIIDCQNSGRSFYIHSGETCDLKIIALTLTNGNVTDYGAGIYCSNSSPQVLGCVISNNSADDGGGVYCTGNGSPIFFQCSINNNSAHGNNNNALGGGVRLENSWTPRFVSSSFSSNTATSSGYQAAGGAICADYSSIIIVDCQYIGNSASGSSSSNNNHSGAVYIRHSYDSLILLIPRLS